MAMTALPPPLDKLRPHYEVTDESFAWRLTCRACGRLFRVPKPRPICIEPVAHQLAYHEEPVQVGASN